MSFDPLPQDDESDPPNTPPEDTVEDTPAPETPEPEGTPEGTTPDGAPVADVTPTTPPAEPEGPTRATIEFMDSNFGTKYGDKYATDVEFHAARPHLEQRLAQRDEDAVYGREVRAHETEFREYMAGRQTGQQPGQPQQQAQQPTERQPVSFDQLKSWENEIKAARAGGTEPNAETVRRYTEEAEAYNRRSYEMSLQQQNQITPEQIQQQVNQQVQQRMTEQQQQQTATQQQHTYVNRVQEQNAHWLHVDGDAQKPLTPQGQQFVQLAKQQTDQGVPMAQAVNNALAAVMPSLTQQQPQPVLGVTPQATRQPNTATEPVGTLTDEQMKAKFLKDAGDWVTGMGNYADWKRQNP